MSEFSSKIDKFSNFWDVFSPSPSSETQHEVLYHTQSMAQKKDTKVLDPHYFLG